MPHLPLYSQQPAAPVGKVLTALWGSAVGKAESPPFDPMEGGGVDQKDTKKTNGDSEKESN